MACAATRSSTAMMPSPRPTISASRRAESGSSVARSSMPSAPAVLMTVNDTGWASRLASAASDWAATAWMLRPRSGPPTGSSPVGSPDHGVSRSFTDRSLAELKTDARTMRT